MLYKLLWTDSLLTKNFLQHNAETDFIIGLLDEKLSSHGN
jgi:hypothetical protein